MANNTIIEAPLSPTLTGVTFLLMHWKRLFFFAVLAAMPPLSSADTRRAAVEPAGYASLEFGQVVKGANKRAMKFDHPWQQKLLVGIGFNANWDQRILLNPHTECSLRFLNSLEK